MPCDVMACNRIQDTCERAHKARVRPSLGPGVRLPGQHGGRQSRAHLLLGLGRTPGRRSLLSWPRLLPPPGGSVTLGS